jgi:AraC family transcriptional regulator
LGWVTVASRHQQDRSSAAGRQPVDWPSACGRRHGVCCDFDEAGQFDHVSGVAVAGLTGLAPELGNVRIPSRRYLVFRHRRHVSRIHATWQAIMDRWLPASGLRLANAPDFQCYTEAFDANSGLGGIEIWVPIEQ